MRHTSAALGIASRCLLLGACLAVSTSFPRRLPGASSARRITPYRDILRSEGVLKDIDVDGYRYCVADCFVPAPICTLDGKGAAMPLDAAAPLSAPTAVLLSAPPAVPKNAAPKNAVVLLHGITGSIYDWRHLLKPLAEGRRVIALDLLGAGESDKPAEVDYSLRAQARRVRGVLDALGVEKATLVGNSYGGGVALVFAQDWPERLDRLVLINSICYKDHVPSFLPLSKMPGAAGAAQAIPLGRSAGWIVKAISPTVRRLSDVEVDTYIAEIGPWDRRRSMIASLRAIDPGDIREFEQRIRSIHTPTLLLWGRFDQTVPIDLGRRLARELPNAKLVELDAGHVPNQEAPKQVLEELRKFLP